MDRLLVITLFVCLFVKVNTAWGKIYLVSVGVSDYPGTDMDLALPAQDARTIQWLYQKNRKAETLLLVDSQVTHENVLAGMRDLYGKAKIDDIVVFFFSGHGYPGGFAGYDKRISYQEIRDAMAKSKSRNKMIFADACFSGGMRNDRTGRSGSDYASLQVMLFLSSRTTETSLEQRDLENGLFTTCLQKGLRGGADKDRDRIITAKELFLFVSEGVRRLSNNKQHPVMWGKFDNDMPVMKW